MRSRLLAIATALIAVAVLPVVAALSWTMPPAGATVTHTGGSAGTRALSSGGDAAFLGSMAGRHLNAPVVGMASTADGGGYWLAATDGGVFAFGDAPFYGSLAGAALASPIVGIAGGPAVSGYWLVSADGAVHPFGGAVWYHDMGGRALNAPVVGMASTADGDGYWLAAADGGVFAFGDALFSGSLVGELTAGTGPVVGIAAFTDDAHFVLATSLGEVDVVGFSGGSWPDGWMQPTNAPMVGVANWGTGDRPGWWSVGSDGGVFALGYAPFYGSMGATALAAPVVGVSATPTHLGYWLVAADGGVFAF
jgi:hypothetical protein